MKIQELPRYHGMLQSLQKTVSITPCDEFRTTSLQF